MNYSGKVTIDYPALTGNVVTERHVNVCRKRGHATHIIEGETQSICPRCGEVREA